jgi:hypothetical protein
MTSPMSSRSLRTSIVSHLGCILRRFVPLSVLMAGGIAHATPPAATTTALSISATSVPYKTPIILTAKVTSGGSPVSSGLVLFCDSTAVYCENNSALATVQLTSSGATAVVKIGSGPLGVHSYKAIYRANNLYATSTSNTVSYTVQGTYSSVTKIASSGSVGNYTLASTVAGVGSLTVGPTGTISIIDTSAGNQVLGTQPLSTAVLSTNFATAAGSPFTIGNKSTSTRSVTIESAYLDGDNNLDIVTGDYNQVITVLLGNGDGTFQPKVNYPGCTTGVAVKMLLADFNRDGNTDIALGCASGSSGGLVVVLGNGDGSFRTPTMYSSGDVEGLALGDFNNDGILDVVVTDQSHHDVTEFIGNGDGTFHAGTVVATTPSAAHDIVVGDFNQDGNDDIAYAVATSVASSNLSDLYVAIGKGDGTFKTPTKVASQIGEFLASGDFNADNKPDIVATTITGATHIGQSLFVLLGNGTGSFNTPVTYTSDIPSDPHIADVNGDGKPDIIAGGSFGALVYIGNGDGTFQAYTEPVIGGFSLTYAVSAGDFNNDGNADLSGTDASSPKAAVSLSEVDQTADASALTGVAMFPLGSGVHHVDASYPGDSVYTASVSSTVALMAAPTPTTLTLVVSPPTATLSGQTVTLTATLSPYTVSPPTTTTDGQSVNFYSGSSLIGSGTLSSGVATLATTSLPVGSDALKAIYPGDTNYNPSTSNVITVTVTGILLSSSPNPSIYGQAVKLTSTTPSGATGTVTFKDGTAILGTSTITGTSATFATSTLTGGSHNLTAVYSGDGSHSAATSPVVTQVVNKANVGDFDVAATPPTTTYGQTVTITATVKTTDATGTVTFTSGGVTLGTGTLSGGATSITTTVLPVGTDTITASYSGDNNYNSASGTATETVKKGSLTSTLTSSANPAAPGVSVTFTDTLSSAVTGTVTFSNGSTVLGTANINGSVATLSTSSLPLGSNTITATYGGDSNNNSSSATMTETIAKNNSTVTVTTSPSPSSYGQTVTITASVPAGDTGTITFSNGATTIGSGTVDSSGKVVVTTSTLPVGTDTITASYGGDAANNSATGTATQTVTKASPTMTLSSSVNPSVASQAVSFTATVPANATGTVTFTSGATNLGTATISNGTATISTSSLPIGSDSIAASYGGDSNNNTATASLTQTVNKATPTVTVTTSGPSTYGQSVTITATVPTGVTGTITFTNGATSLGSGTVSGGTVAITTSSLPVGSDTITASYGGDTNNNSATGTVVQTVGKVTPTSTLTSSQNPSAPGASVTFTDTLPNGVTGTVTFTNGATTLGTATVTNGVATVTISSLPGGSNTITATYNGDGNDNSVVATLVQTVQKLTPTVTVTTAPSTSTYGQTVTISSTVTSGATGTVTFTSGGATLGTGTLNGSGNTSITTTALPVGSDTITATYNGDSTYNTGTATTTHTVSKVTPAMTLTSSVNPADANQPVKFTATLPSNVTGTVSFTSNGTSIGTGTIANGVATLTTSTLPIGTDAIVATYAGDSNDNGATANLTETINKGTPTVTVTANPSTSTYGQTVTITSSVLAGATGTITVTSGGQTLGSGTVSAAGTVTVTTSSLLVGTDTITASYSGDSNDNPATGSTTETVSKGTPTVTVTTSGPSTYGQTVTITTTLPPGTTGTVTVSSGGTTIGTGTVNSSGTVTVTTSALPVGTDTITVSYGGDTNNNPATGTTTQVVNQIAPTVTLVSSANPSSVNQSVTFTATVPASATGTITFLDGSTPIGTAPVASGTASVTTSSLTGGTHTITASYSGDTNDGAATSAPLTQTVNKLTPTLPAPVVSAPTITAGGSETITETVPPGVSGPVTFSNGSTPIGTAPVVGGVATITVTNLPVGSDPITASTPGDTNNNPATSPATTVTVTKGTPTVGLTSSLNPSQANQPVTFTATLPTGVTGTVTFTDGPTAIGTATVTNGVATVTDNTLTTGTHTITASYGGDSNYNTATSSPLTQNVDKASPSLPAPVVSPTTTTYGSTVTITETVPTGVTGPVTFSNGSTPIGTAPVVGGVATITVSNLPVGSDPITASTPGDSNNNPATSPATTVTVTKTTPVLPAPTVSNTNPTPNSPVTITEPVPSGVPGPVTFIDNGTVLGTATIVDGVATLTVTSLPLGANPITASVPEGPTSFSATSPATTVTVAKTAPTVTLVSSANPSAANQSITFTASITVGATGTMTFRDGSTILGTGTVNAAGIATLTTSALTIGTHTITAAYGGDSNYGSATSAPLNQVVGTVPTMITLTQSSSTELLGSSVTFAATVSAPTPTPTGTVSFMEGTTVLGSAPLSTNGGVTVSLDLSGNASWATTSLKTGSHTITAVYSGDTTFATSTSAPVKNVVQDFTNTNTGKASQSVMPGESTSYTFTIAPVGATTFMSDVNLKVEGLPEGSTATFSPVKVAAGGGSATVTLNVTTSSSLSARNSRPQRGPLSHDVPVALGMLGLAGLGAARKYRRKMPRMLMVMLLLAGSLLPVAALSGCAGGYFAFKPTNYTVTVTGSEGTIQHAATATLVVQ